MQSFLRLFLPICLLLTGPVSVWGHPSHESVADVRWNPETRNLEVTLRLHSVELEQVVRRASQDKVKLDDTGESEPIVADYLQDAFRWADAQGKVRPLKWVGMEVELRWTWVYFEIPAPLPLEGSRVANSVFFELLPDQANLVNVQAGPQRASITSVPDHAEHRLEFRRPHEGFRRR